MSDFILWIGIYVAGIITGVFLFFQWWSHGMDTSLRDGYIQEMDEQINALKGIEGRLK